MSKEFRLTRLSRKKLFLALLCILIAGITFDRFGYYPSDLKIGNNYMAKEYCSCIFVQEMADSWCQANLVKAPFASRFLVDRERQSVKVESLWVLTSRADFRGSRFGCHLNR